MIHNVKLAAGLLSYDSHYCISFNHLKCVVTGQMDGPQRGNIYKPHPEIGVYMACLNALIKRRYGQCIVITNGYGHLSYIRLNDNTIIKPSQLFNTLKIEWCTDTPMG